ncbi:MAG: hypothetical protein JRN68_04500 [Nitrososphaerota archaeon]|nr:hypothetical protein [Nitrososphaerota archaeon]
MRTNIAVDSQIHGRLAKIAKQNRSTVYELTNSYLSICAEAMERGLTLDDIRGQVLIRYATKNLDVVLLPGSVIEYMVNQLYSVKKSEMDKLFEEAGAEVGKYFKIKGLVFQDILEMARLGYASIGLRDISVVRQSSTKIIVSIYGLLLGKSATEVGLKFVEGLMNEFGFKVTGSELAEGAVRISFEVESPIP